VEPIYKISTKKIRLLLAAVVIPCLIISITRLYYCDKVEYVRPLALEGEMQLRNDRFGDGHYAARRAGGKRHAGVDILADLDTPVIAIRGGRARALIDEDGFGNYIIITHWDETKSLYGHLSRVLLPPLGFVRQGDVIGEVGKTGNANYKSMKAHMHFEIRRKGKTIDPTFIMEAENIKK